MDKNTLSDDMNVLIDELAFCATTWRGAHRHLQHTEAQHAVDHYHRIMAFLWDLPWDANLDPDIELPDEFMPQYYLDYWKKYYQFQEALTILASQWYTATTSRNSRIAETLLQSYHSTLAQFFEHTRARKRMVLPSQACLPDQFLPDRYLLHKQRK